MKLFKRIDWSAIVMGSIALAGWVTVIYLFLTELGKPGLY